MAEIAIRLAEPSDYPRVVAVVDDWWGGREIAGALPRLFFVHFKPTTFVAERGGELMGFLCGFFSQTSRDEAYIHFVGVHPDARKDGLARRLYERFFDVCRADGRRVVRSVTSPVNKGSVAFHKKMGFELEPGDGEVDGLPVLRDAAPRGGTRVQFVKRLG